jgi:hypothetical protein
MEYDIEKAISKAVEPVGAQSFHALVKTLTDGLPMGVLDLWQTDLVSRQPTEIEAQAAARVALQIEDTARLCFARLFLNSEFRAALIKDMQAGHGLKMAKIKTIRRTKPFEEAIRQSPSKSTKEIINDLLAKGRLIDDGNDYLIVNAETDRSRWAKVAKTTLDSKFSKLRKKLRNT